MNVLRLILWLVFFGSAVALAILILLQESKGGGLAEAFGGSGAETFGVKSGGVSRVTFTLAGVYMASAVMLHATWNA